MYGGQVDDSTELGNHVRYICGYCERIHSYRYARAREKKCRSWGMVYTILKQYPVNNELRDMAEGQE
jgi:hypothetical protein